MLRKLLEQTPTTFAEDLHYLNKKYEELFYKWMLQLQWVLMGIYLLALSVFCKVTFYLLLLGTVKLFMWRIQFLIGGLTGGGDEKKT